MNLTKKLKFKKIEEPLPESGERFEGMAYKVVGNGTPLILMHGFGESMLVWRQQVDELAKTYEVHLVDLLGHGQSEKPVAGKYDPQSHADRLYRYIKHFRLNRPVIVGHSMGGGIALLLAVRLCAEAARSIGGLILLGSMFYNHKVPLVVRAMRLRLLGRLLVGLAPAQLGSLLTLKRVIFDHRKITKEMVSIYSEQLKNRAGRMALVRTAEQIVIPPDDLAERDVGKIDVPTLIIWGEFDAIVPTEVGKRIHTLIPNSRLETIKRCGHCPNEEQPAETVRLMLDFLDGLPIREEVADPRKGGPIPMASARGRV